MTYNEAKAVIFRNLLIGTTLGGIGTLSTFISMLKWVYVGDAMSGAAVFARGLKGLIWAFYSWSTPYLETLWKYSPVPTQEEYLSSRNLFVIVIYLVGIFGLSQVRRAFDLMSTLSRIRKGYQEYQIASSLAGRTVPMKMDTDVEVPTVKPNRWTLIHSLYLAPFIVGIALLIAGKVFHLT
ncbi:YniB family protein [Pandoraea sp. CB10b_02]|uniref:YniB family protein n=1 Tax=Pandoraea sp. CB10b_02 TaxID=2014535 RepID=UPI00257F4791|nr:YniB family protein [Pandoraea sp. CB10b_02]